MSGAAFLHLTDPEALPPGLRGGSVAVGNFDGVHLGHRAVLDQALELARKASTPALVLTFEPHPRSYFNPEQPVFRLTPPQEKTALLRDLGFDCVIEQTFDEAFSRLLASEFVEDLIGAAIGARNIVTGEDFHFGFKREGTPKFLQDFAAKAGLSVSLVQPVRDHEGRIISSTRIREALAQGDLALAGSLLGRDWTVRGRVVGGKKIGRTLGYPTANIELAPQTGLRHGVYTVQVWRADGSQYDGVASFGRRPTFDNGPVLLEVFLFDFDDSLYGESLKVALRDFQRPELKFDSAEALVEQMQIDAERARAYFGHR